MEKQLPLHKHPKMRWHLLSAASSILKFNTRESQGIALEHKKITFGSLPRAFEGFRIIHISDLHIWKVSGKEERLLAILKSLSADLVAFTGDFSYAYSRYEEAAFGYMKKIYGVFKDKCRVLGVRGNSDSTRLMDRLKGLGVVILNNEHIEVRRGADCIYIVGVDDPHHRMDDIQKACGDIPMSAFKILLAHSPDILLRKNNTKIDLLLAGHTHGGQVRIPRIGPILTKTEIGRRFSSGVVYENGLCANINRGIGGVGLRYRCPPEVSFLELRVLKSC